MNGLSLDWIFKKKLVSIRLKMGKIYQLQFSELERGKYGKTDKRKSDGNCTERS